MAKIGGEMVVGGLEGQEAPGSCSPACQLRADLGTWPRKGSYCASNCWPLESTSVKLQQYDLRGGLISAGRQAGRSPASRGRFAAREKRRQLARAALSCDGRPARQVSSYAANSRSWTAFCNCCKFVQRQRHPVSAQPEE